MDYDDSDFQSQNFQLGGEDSTKFPPGLRSYALPKFDLDESLQVHLRYDTLVETEVLLGIQNQEENCWIEDFSRENSGIEFSSSAAESCSISRRNNVWSEATSSESVEMLLKSVGQDEMLTKQIIIEESDFCDGLNNLNNQMDPSLNQDDSIAPKIGDIIDSNPTLPPDKCLENLSDLSTDAARILAHVEAPIHQDGKSEYGSLVDLDPSPVNKKFDCHMISAAEQVDMDQKVTSSSMENNAHENDHVSSVSALARGNHDATFERMQVEPSGISMQNITIGAADGCIKVACCEKPGDLLQDGAEKDKIQVLRDTQMDDQQHERRVVESCTGNAENLSSSALNLDSSVHIAEELNEVLSKADTQQMKSGILSKDSKTGVHFTGSTQEASFVAVEIDKSIEGSNTGSSNDGLGNPCSPLVKIDSFIQITERYSHKKPEDLSRDSGCPVERVIFIKEAEMDVQLRASKLETTLLVVEETQNSEGRLTENRINDVGNFSSAVVHSPTSMIHETRVNVESLNELEVHGAVFNAQNPEPALVEKDMLVKVIEKDSSSYPDSTLNLSGDVLPDQAHYSSERHVSYPWHQKLPQKCDSSLPAAVLNDVNTVHSDVPNLEKENESLSTDSEGIEIKIDDPLVREKRVEASSPGQSTATLTTEHIVGDESVSTEDAILLASGNKMDATVLVAADVSGQKVPEKEETVPGVSTEPCLQILTENCKSGIASGPLPASDSRQHPACNSAAESPEMLTQSLSAEKSFHSIHREEPEASMAIKATQKCAKELEGHPTVHASVVTEIDGSKLLGNSCEKYKVTTLQVTGETACNTEIPTQPIPSSVDGSSHGIGQNNQHEGEANLVSGDASGGRVLLLTTEGDVLNRVEQSSSKPATSSDATETANGSPTSGETKCDSPTVISCSEPSQNEKEQLDGGEKESLDQNDPVSKDLPHIPSDINRHADNVKSTSEDDRSFTFVVGSLADLSERESGKGWKPFSNIKPFELPQTGEGSPTTPVLCQASSVNLQETSHGSRKVSDEQRVRRGTKGKGKDKTRLADSATERGTATGGKPAKETSRPKQTVEKDVNQSSASAYSNGTINRAMQVEERRQYAYVDGSSTRSSSVPTIQAPGLPDLNTSASSQILCHQPFTDSQQVQLRAQIFVYGSLIQCTPPDESCMVSAFGDVSRDGGRSMWENSWRVSVERFHSQKSLLSNLESPLQSRSGVRVSEQVSRCSPLQNKTLSTPTSRTGSKGAPPAIVNPTTPVPSSVWSFSTPSRDVFPSSSMPRGPLLDSHPSLSPLPPYQSPYTRPYLGNNSAWLPQASTGPAPWAVSPRTPALAGVHYSSLPIAEAVQVASVRDPPAPRLSSVQLASPSSLPPTVGPINVLSGTTALAEATRTNISPAKHASADQKPRKRKKRSVAEELGQISTVTPARTEPVSATAIGKHFTTSLGIPSPAQSISIDTASSPVSTTAPVVSSTHYQIVGSGDKGQKVIFSEETFSRIEQAKLHADDAAALAAAAIRHSEGIWSQLAIQKNSGLVSEVEAKLASAAVAAAAAASVAKAAAAAAKVASDAALQAKLMADEALNVPPMGNSSWGPETALPDGRKNFGKANPSSGLKSKGETASSGSTIVAAREAARKRVEAASAATKRAENFDAVVKAAELAAEAVSQAGAVIAMGDPIPLTLSELVEAGPGGYWKAEKVSVEHSVKENSTHRGEQLNKDGTDEGIDRSIKSSNRRPLNTKETLQIRNEGNAPSIELSVENEARMVNGILQGSVAGEGGLAGQKGRKTSDHAKTVGVITELEVGSRAASSNIQNGEGERHQQMGTSKEIKEASLVEVVRDAEGCRGVWFSAKVLGLKDGKAYVCYNELLQDEGPDHLKEWIPLEGGGDKAPRIRIAHPMTAVKFEGTRKRRRAAIGNYAWSVGDRVDAWMQDGWWEGIVTEKSKEDETKLTVHFPAKGDFSIVRAWNLRPSLIWKDDQWMEWSRENNSLPHENDTPQEKRQKLGRLEVVIGPQIEAGGNNKLSNELSAGDSRTHEESRPLPLSAKDKIFAVGKNIREENNADAVRVKRTGLQMEGSRVIFGVPKPGKKRKFMDVSKHYVADKSAKINEGIRTDSIKFTKYLVPQGTLGWKNSSKVDTKGKREQAAADSRPKVPKSGKAQSILSKSLSEKDSSLISVASALTGGTGQDLLTNAKAFAGHERSSLETSTLKAGEGLLSFLSAPVSDGLSSKKSSSAIEGDTGTRRKLAPGRKVARDDEKCSSRTDNPGKLIPDAAEPRRSNRRIQPTSRLLEGLQNALIGTKIPSFSRGKGVKAGQHRRNYHG
ncbi:uncharacterized protein LOC131248260 isoform X2 [Magnolia sinica]|uniref:uncharacterized protein LOC131248260 isoform X2 n=1 Tax=Magnolia sinica TaxID=86752 RepID=UPI002659621B|nr:uncharacterized protein LOC131248260 isoform X2 [Magnolia sinica]